MQLTVENLSAKYSKKQKFISSDISFTVNGGETMAIMGPSGSGKSTLLKAVLGIIPLRFREGKIFFNGNDISDTGLACIKHKVGFVPQDDILVNELTVRENIESFHTIAVDSGYSKREVSERIDYILETLDLKNSTKNIENQRVNQISGGQRKRVNLAMELINEPDILIVDEPTSGLSSLDSLSLIDYLKRYAIEKDKIVIFIIHQPSSDIYRIFNRLLLLNDRGEAVFSGYRSLLPDVYNTYPEEVMYDLEKNKIQKSVNISIGKKEKIEKKPLLRSPAESLKDFFALLKRQFLVKARDRMSQIITFFAPPLLAIIIGMVFKFAPSDFDYEFANNSLFGQFIFMMIISGMFLGFEGSATEVIRDRGILNRESLRGLSLTSYYFSKLVVLIFFGAIQSLLFVLISLYILNALYLFIPNILTMLIIVSISITLGLVISMLVKTPLAAFKISTMLLIPQIILGGAFLPYSNMGKEIYLWEDQSNTMPITAKIVPASWAYEFAMSFNYEWNKQDGENINIALENLTLNPKDTFLSLLRSQSIPISILKALSLEDKQNKTYIYNSWVLLSFFVFFLLMGLLIVRRDYTDHTIYLTALQLGLVALFVALPILLIEPIEKEDPIVETEKIFTNAMDWNNANKSCQDLGMTLPTIDQLIGRYSSGKLPKSIFWTSQKYANTKNAYWSVNFSKINGTQLTREKVNSSDKALIAYTVNSVKALALCLK